MEEDSPERRCRRLAAAQRHLITRRQAFSCGISPSGVARRKSSGSWAPVLPGVYALSGDRLDWATKVLAASLWAGRGSAVSHCAAAAAWGLNGFAPPRRVDVTTARSLKAPATWVHVHRARPLGADEVSRVDHANVTSPSRTLVDVAATLPQEVAESALDDALAMRLVSVPRLRWYLRPRSGRRPTGAKTLDRLVAQRTRDGVALESVLERRVWDVIASSDLPKPVRQHRVYENGALVARIDLAYPDAAIAIEVDGYRWHSGRDAWKRDLIRRNRLTSAGWRVLHVMHDDLREPGRVLQQIRMLLADEVVPEIAVSTIPGTI